MEAFAQSQKLLKTAMSVQAQCLVLVKASENYYSLTKQTSMYQKPSKIFSILNITETWKDSRDSSGKGGAAGRDNLSAHKFREKLESNISTIRKEVVFKNYKFSPLKAFPLQKNESGKQRIICIPTVKDRLVQRVILRYLTIKDDKLKVITEDVSFGAFNGKQYSVHKAIDLAIKRRSKSPWVLKTDVSSFFDRIPRGYLKKEIKKRFKKNNSIIPMLDKVIDCEIKPKDRKEAKIIHDNGIVEGVGLRQGMPLSPLLSNLVLNKFDRKVKSKGLNLIRYADDIICFCNSRKECLSAKAFIEHELQKVELEIPELGTENSKTVIYEPSENVIFLGVEIYKKGTVYNKKIPQKTIDRAIKKYEDMLNIEENVKNGETIFSIIQKMKGIPAGYKAAFPKCTNACTLKDLLEKKADETKTNLLTKTLGADVLNNMDESKRKFMGFD